MKRLFNQTHQLNTAKIQPTIPLDKDTGVNYYFLYIVLSDYNV